MIKIKDNFLPDETFRELQNYCREKEFETVVVGSKEFSVLETPDNVIPFLQQPGHEIILSFIRQANELIDTKLNIHADGIIQGQISSLASVLYINDSQGVTKNGTAFWYHEKHGYKLPNDCSIQEFNRLLTEDANDIEKWKQLDYLKAKQNRLLTYPSNYFHSKWPQQITEGTRIVLVTFYKKTENG